MRIAFVFRKRKLTQHPLILRSLLSLEDSDFIALLLTICESAEVYRNAAIVNIQKFAKQATESYQPLL